MPDPNDGYHPVDPADPDVCLSLDGRIRYSDFCICGCVDDLRLYRGDWLCSACRDEAHELDGEYADNTMEAQGEAELDRIWREEGYA